MLPRSAHSLVCLWGLAGRVVDFILSPGLRAPPVLRVRFSLRAAPLHLLLFSIRGVKGWGVLSPYSKSSLLPAVAAEVKPVLRVSEKLIIPCCYYSAFQYQNRVNQALDAETMQRAFIELPY